jgi:hypothetical protein
MAVDSARYAFRIRIDGKWSASDFAEFFSALEQVYLALGELMQSGFRNNVAEESRRQLPVGTNEDGTSFILRVERLKFGSPGWAGLSGLGEVTKQLKELVFGLVDRIIQSEDRAISRELSRAQIEAVILENQAARLRLVEQQMQAAERAVVFDARLEQAMKSMIEFQRPLAKAVSQGKITDVGEPEP